MNSKYPFFTVCCFLFVFSCSKESKIVFTDSYPTTKNNNVVDVLIPVASGDENIANSINSAVADVVINALHTGGNSEPITSESIEESIDEFNAEFNAFDADFPEGLPVWEAQIDGEIMHQSAEILSMSITSYINTGGAQGSLNISFLNFDTKTGRRIKNQELFKDKNAFNNIAKVYFQEEAQNEDILFDLESFKLPENIGFNEEGVILLYNAYEIGPYASGIIEFTIPFEKANSFLHFDSTE
jgi:Deacetylase PdaC/Protein of unknown function (DUF3298)